ncbi:hypothetical protein CgunFtcFv8_003775 [Champsocephalus gunnari]|uniref:Uncharacterized protein n=1 Tax=Champsocephalus gunnari TaxID=52237 RepID=A0AAN8E2G5_CHAGU|nr:hypothetical protein CgunFtcFv8_003775 [Champsocephalus gunnari]
MKKEEGVRKGGGRKNTCLTPLSNKEVMFLWKATINLDTGTQALIDLIRGVQSSLMLLPKNSSSPPDPPTPSIYPAPPLSSGLLVFQAVTSRVPTKN